MPGAGTDYVLDISRLAVTLAATSHPFRETYEKSLYHIAVRIRILPEDLKFVKSSRSSAPVLWLAIPVLTVLTIIILILLAVAFLHYIETPPYSARLAPLNLRSGEVMVAASQSLCSARPYSPA